MSIARRPFTTHDIPNLCVPGEAEAHLRNLFGGRRLDEPTVLLVCGDERARPVFHLHVVDCDRDPTASECAVVLDRLLDHAEALLQAPVGGLVLGLTRPGDDAIQAYDRRWFRALHRTCHQRGSAAWGVYVVTRHRARAVHIDDAA